MYKQLGLTALTRIEGANYRYGFHVSAPGLRPTFCNSMMIEVMCWCREQFGPADGVDGETPVERRWRADFTVIDFARSEDATAFRMRWC